MKTKSCLILKAMLVLALFTGFTPQFASGQDKEKDTPPLPPDDMIFGFFDEDEDAIAFPFPDLDEMDVQDTDAEMPYFDEPLPDPQAMKRMERALRQMHQAMRNLDREMRQLKHVHPKDLEQWAENIKEFPPFPPDFQDFHPPFPGHRFFLEERLGAPDTVIVKSDSLTKVIILGGKKGDTIVRKTVKVLKRGEGNEADTVVMERIITPGKRRAFQSEADFSPRVPGRLKVVDLSKDDLAGLAKSALAPSTPYEPLGIPEIKVRPLRKGALNLAFPAANLSSFDVSLYDEKGDLIFQESIKKNMGDYARQIQIDRKPPFFIKINQGKKTLIKKIIPDR
ncbi:MAG: hypothetical protein AB1583_08505 [Bacteroidota bacterium]